jgi:hypothetical protein
MYNDDFELSFKIYSPICFVGQIFNFIFFAASLTLQFNWENIK